MSSTFRCCGKHRARQIRKKEGIQLSADVGGLYAPLRDNEISGVFYQDRFVLNLGYLQVKLQFSYNTIDVTHYEKTYKLSALNILKKAGFTCSDKPFNPSSFWPPAPKEEKPVLGKQEIEKRLAELLNIPSILLSYSAKDSYELYFDDDKSLSELEEYSKILQGVGLKMQITPAVVHGGETIFPPGLNLRNTLEQASEKLNIVDSMVQLKI